jgi:hypothetical protein
MDFLNTENLALLTSCLSFFGFGFLSLSDRLKVKHEAVTRTMQIRDAIHLADFELRKLALKETICEEDREKVFEIATTNLSPNFDKFALLYKQGMLDRFLASRMANSYYYSILIETSHFAINGRFDFYNIDDWVNIKQKTRKEQKALRKQKDKFLKTTFPDFYDIHFSLHHNARSYLVNSIVLVFNKIPSKAKQHLQNATKWLKSMLHTKQLADFYATFISPLIAPCIVSVGIYFVIYFTPSVIKSFKTIEDSPHLSNTESATKPIDKPVKIDKTQVK